MLAMAGFMFSRHIRPQQYWLLFVTGFAICSKLMRLARCNKVYAP